MFVVRPRKMQEARYLCGSFPLAFLLLGSWFVTNINTYPTQLINSWTRSPPISLKLMKTRETTSGTTISYKLDSWSQYDNPEEGAEREGDIYQSSKARKTITKDKTLLWPNGIVNYYVHSSIANKPKKLAMLEDALRTIMSKTCIKFLRIKEYAKLPANSWVNITGHQKGCFSELGRNAYGPTSLNLDVNLCLHTIGHTIHETLHTLGVYHEHMRPDRDKYITIIWENIKKEDVFNFRMLNNNTVTDYGLPYDYDSIMHYSMTAFSTNRSLPTIIPTSSYVEIGQRSHLSHYDIQKLLIAYNCTAVGTKLENNKKLNLEKPKKLPNRRKLPQPQSLNKTVIETEVKSHTPTIVIHNSILNKLDDKNADLGKSMDRLNQVAFLRSVYPIQPNYYPVPLSPIYLYINLHFYLNKK
ncbi:zinc metalloproteinase nas-4-like [Temnothorax longispinosus]|uniref:zinc metalloproteinase nas-4-like n=1 Tax=Temnothorax longispinosus TaxID=300112 RepID=UPI003A99208A